MRLARLRGFWRPALGILVLLVLNGASATDLAFPAWLSELTGLTEWPDEYAPFIALPDDPHLFNITSTAAQRDQRDCVNVRTSDCSFDCGHCVLPSDIETCLPMSQSFDDGPTQATSELLDGLKESKTKTTFFLIGQNVVEWPEIVRRQRREGHVLAVHTWSHKFLPSLSNEEVFAELQWCIWAVNASAGVVPRFFRPPYGGLDNRIREVAALLNLVPVLWDRDTNDWQVNDGTRTASEVLADFSQWTANGPRSRYRGWFASAPKAKGLLLEHDLSRENVRLALAIKKKIKHKQKTVAQCARQRPYV